MLFLAETKKQKDINEMGAHSRHKEYAHGKV